jgi:hypothetical protein
MKKTFDKAYILLNKGCYEKHQVEALSFINKEEIGVLDILNSEMPLKDKGWFLIRKTQLTPQQKAELAYRLAGVVSELFNKKYPNDSRVNDCLQAIQDFKAGKIDISVLREKRAAADAAADAAAAYAAAYAAADAAAAAYAAAYAAADAAADAAAAYAAAAAAAYAADSYRKKVLQVLIDFSNEQTL